MKQILLLFLLLVGMMFAVYWLMQPQNSEKISLLNFGQTGLVTEQPPGNVVKVGSNLIKVELANNEEKRQIGLSNHTSLEKGTGMLFIFDQKNIRPDFWMKGMKFPIDIIWINDNKVAQINAEVPVANPSASDIEIPRYSPSQTIDYVLEIPSGEAKERGIKVGDTVELPSL
jgi:uncharacterized protein